ncbi:DNA pilot protein [Microviridae sp.]|nr:DNA pilot protein [Microviridae sp.]
MPVPLLGAAVGAIGSTIASGLFTGRQNRKSRRWSERMYDRQYNDNVDFWRMQNDYNSPERQMERLKAANLNPNMVYGGSPSGVAGSADKISTPDIQPAQFRTPDVGNIDVLGKYFDYEIKQAQTDNLRAQNTVILEDAALKNATRTKLGVETKGLQSTLPFLADAASEQLRKMKSETDMNIDENTRRNAMNAKNLVEAGERILSHRVGRQQTLALMRNTNLSSDLKTEDLRLRKMNIFPGDPMWLRALNLLLSPYTDRIKSFKPFKN